MDVGKMVLRDGDRVTATGRLVRDGSGDWFEPPLPVAFAAAGPRRVRPPWRGAVRVAGADFGELRDRVERDGAVAGSATLTGVWSAGRLQVERQSPPEYPRQPPMRWVTPPCPPPRGGWPRPSWGPGDRNLSFDLGDLRETGAAVAVTIFRPSQDQAVLVVAAADAAAVQARLRPQLGELLCVVPSRWSRAELGAVAAHVRAHHEEWNVYTSGESSAEDGQAQVTAALTRVLPEIAAWAAPLPAGILAIEPWLAPLPPPG